MTLSLGYRPDKENRAALHGTAKPFRLTSSFRAPPEIDHSSWRKVENQQSLGSCVGHGMQCGCEVLNYIDTRGETVELSRMFCYLTSQDQVGLLGQDTGSSITGAAQALETVGVCRERLLPYTGQYHTNIPRECYEEAASHKCRNHSVLRSYDEIYNWLASGVGIVLIGIPWYESFAKTRDGILERGGGQMLGYHCVCLWGYVAQSDGQGRKYIKGENSHGTDWGDRGFFVMSPRLLGELTQDRNSEFIGISDLEEYNPRGFDWGQWRMV